MRTLLLVGLSGEAAGQFLDPSVVILEHGRSERTAAEYLDVHGKADARVPARHPPRRSCIARLAAETWPGP